MRFLLAKGCIHTALKRFEAALTPPKDGASGIVLILPYSFIFRRSTNNSNNNLIDCCTPSADIHNGKEYAVSMMPLAIRRRSCAWAASGPTNFFE